MKKERNDRILRMLAAGEKPENIGETLGVSMSTVYRIRKEQIEKLQKKGLAAPPKEDLSPSNLTSGAGRTELAIRLTQLADSHLEKLQTTDKPREAQAIATTAGILLDKAAKLMPEESKRGDLDLEEFILTVEAAEALEEAKKGKKCPDSE